MYACTYMQFRIILKMVKEATTHNEMKAQYFLAYMSMAIISCQGLFY